MDLCLETKRRPVARVSKRGWDQGCLDLVGAWAAAARAAEEEEDRSETGSGTEH